MGHDCYREIDDEHVIANRIIANATIDHTRDLL